MKKKLILLLCLFHFVSAQVYLDLNAEIASRYAFRCFVPAGKQPVFTLNASAYLAKYNISITSWYVSSLTASPLYQELGSMLNYHYEIREQMYLSGGLTALFYPGRSDMPQVSPGLNLSFSDYKVLIPYSVETQYDPFIGSWYWKFSAAYTWDTFLPFHFSLAAGLDLLPHSYFGIPVSAGLSDLSLQVGTYLSVNNWFFSPKLSYIIPLKPASRPSSLPLAKLNVGYIF